MKRPTFFLAALGCVFLTACPPPESSQTSQTPPAPGSGMAVSYPGFPSVLYVGEPFGPYLPTVTGGTAVGYDTTTLLPVGISVDKGTGAIAGTPTVVAPAADYLFWAFQSGGNSAGNASTTLRFSVASQFKALTAIPASAHEYGVGVLLADGRVLLAGGGAPLNLAEVYDPITGKFTTLSQTLKVGRMKFTATRITTGPYLDQVLLAGGDGTTERFNPTDNSFTKGPDLSHARSQHTATVLKDGRILFVGGNNSLDADLWDPATNTISASHPQQVVPRFGHAAVLLGDGRVLVAGGYSYTTNTITATAEVFDPAANSGAGAFSATGSLGEAREFPVAALFVASGKALFVGGDTASGTHYPATAEIFDPAANGGVGAFQATMGAPKVPRRGGHTITELPDHRLLLTGGTDGLSNVAAATASAEIYDPGTGEFSLIGPLTASMRNHYAVSLANGSVIVGGGDYLAANGNVYYQMSVNQYK